MATNLPPSTIDRRDLLAHLIPDPDECLLVAGLAGSAKDSAAWTQEADNLITLGGAMGGAGGSAWSSPSSSAPEPISPSAAAANATSARALDAMVP